MVLKNNRDTIQNIDLENKTTYFDSDVPGSISVDIDNSKVVMNLINTIIFSLMTLPCVDDGDLKGGG